MLGKAPLPARPPRVSPTQVFANRCQRLLAVMVLLPGFWKVPGVTRSSALAAMLPASVMLPAKVRTVVAPPVSELASSASAELLAASTPTAATGPSTSALLLA